MTKKAKKRSTNTSPLSSQQGIAYLEEMSDRLVEFKKHIDRFNVILGSGNLLAINTAQIDLTREFVALGKFKVGGVPVFAGEDYTKNRIHVEIKGSEGFHIGGMNVTNGKDAYLDDFVKTLQTVLTKDDIAQDSAFHKAWKAAQIYLLSGIPLCSSQMEALKQS